VVVIFYIGNTLYRVMTPHFFGVCRKRAEERSGSDILPRQALEMHSLEHEMEELLKGYPVVIEVPVAWGDMDAFQHVNNTVYFRYFESARIAYFEAIDFMGLMRETGVGPILAAADCRFKIPLTYPDRVSVGTRVVATGEDRFTMAYGVISHRHGKIAATGEGEMVTFDYNKNRKALLPDVLKKRIDAVEAGLRT
jgi:acyl-CoA thioester hydrolase